MKLDTEKWKNEYLKEEKILKNALKDYNVDILYVGASPYFSRLGHIHITDEYVIEIAIGCENYEYRKKVITILQTIGYYYEDEWKGNKDVTNPYIMQILIKFRNNTYRGRATHLYTR